MKHLFSTSAITSARAAAYGFSGSFADFHAQHDGEIIMQACAAAYLAIINKRERMGQIDPASAQRERVNVDAAVSTVYTIARESSDNGKDIDKKTGSQLNAWLTMYRAANVAIMRVYREDIKHANALKLDRSYSADGDEELQYRIDLHTRRGVSAMERPEDCILKIDLQRIARNEADKNANVEARARFVNALLLSNNVTFSKQEAKINHRALRTINGQITRYIKE